MWTKRQYVQPVFQLSFLSWGWEAKQLQDEIPSMRSSSCIWDIQFRDGHYGLRGVLSIES